MSNFIQSLRSGKPAPGSIRIFWLGQAGFLIMTPSGFKIGIDPYFSDCVARLIPEEGQGFKRLTPPVCQATEPVFDALLISHEHNDHFDVDSITGMMSHPNTKVYGNAPVISQMSAMGFKPNRMQTLYKGDSVSLGECTITPVDCDHGKLAPEALGLLLDFGFVRVYYAGDTSLSPHRLTEAIKAKPEIAILPINGAYGNLDGVQAAKLAGMLDCKICIPCHFWTFSKHRGDPQSFLEAMASLAPNCVAKLMCHGESFDI